MSEQVLKSGNVMERSRTRTITQIAMLGALAGVLMNIEFPIPFLAHLLPVGFLRDSGTGWDICHGTCSRYSD